MPTPFPGMDPYLEQPGLWRELHTRLIVAMADALGPMVRPRYRVAVEQRTYLTTNSASELTLIPDVSVVRGESTTSLRATAATVAAPVIGELPMPEEVTERFLEIHAVSSGAVVTAIELLSPTNKRPGRGRQVYEEKRLQVLGSQTHLVEIDLLRGTPPMEMHLPHDEEADYRIVISRAPERPRASIYLFGVQQAIPPIPIPLRADDPDPTLDLNHILHELYERASYDLLIDYTRPPVPPLDESDAEWADTLLHERGLRAES